MASDTRRPIFGEKSRVFTAKHVIVCISVQLLLLSPVRAQSGANGTQSNGSNQYPYAKFSPSMAIIIVILIAALFLMVFFSIYIRHCSNSTTGGSVRTLGGIGASLRRRTASRGLDPVVIETFPTFVYSTVKGLKIGRGALECAVCLNEFEDDETLRLIPKCDHVFHPECIDAWLCLHVTCPVCRANLVPQPGETVQVPEFNPEDSDDRAETQNPQNDDVSIPVGEDQEEDALPPQVVDRNKSMNQNRPPRYRSIRPSFFEKFPRSHSTGHSLVNAGENTERFTLRLPEDVRKRMMTQALNRSSSFVIFSSEGSSRRGYRPGLGEGSSRGPRSFRRLERGLKSDRWVFSMPRPFFARSSSSVRSPKFMGEGSTSLRGNKTAVKLPSLKCLEPKGNESGLISFESARLPV